uniref:BZIP domain-containing protein n=1 Tax=Acrobeloides nanus TaxID=290746 RepID=A0A914CRL8_9BILA
MHMVWPAFDSSVYGTPNGYSPQTPSNAFFTPNIKGEADVQSPFDMATQIHHRHLASFAQQLTSMSTFQFNTPTQSSNTSSSTPSTGGSTSHLSKKKPNPVPVEQKTAAYFERRRKNNESAKKSREQRRTKEEQNQQRLMQLERELYALQAENQALKLELYKLQPQRFQMPTAMVHAQMSYS